MFVGLMIQIVRAKLHRIPMERDRHNFKPSPGASRRPLAEGEVCLAQVNIAWLHAPLEDPEMAGLANRVDELNQLAEASKGFVWRLPGSQVSHEGLEPFSEDFPGFRRDRLFYNLSVWETVEDLFAYTYASDHTEMLNARKQWLDHIEGTSMALWWIPIGHQPTIAESAERLRAIRRSGPTSYAFTLRKPFPPLSSK